MTSTEIDMASEFTEALAENASLRAQVIAKDAIIEGLQLDLRNKETVVQGFRTFYPRINALIAWSKRNHWHPLDGSRPDQCEGCAVWEILTTPVEEA